VSGTEGGAAAEAAKHSIEFKQTFVAEVKPRTVDLVDRLVCEQIEERIVTELGGKDFDWLSAGWAFLGVAAAAGVALLVLPHATVHDAAHPSEFSPSVKPALWAAVICGGILFAVFTAMHFSTTKKDSTSARGIVNQLRAARGENEPLAPKAHWWQRLWGAVRKKAVKGGNAAVTQPTAPAPTAPADKPPANPT
jgi:hypothetical protein